MELLESEDKNEYDETHFDSAEDAQDFEGVAKAERVSYKSDDDESVKEEVPAKEEGR